jgi:hypothetical protein
MKDRKKTYWDDGTSSEFPFSKKSLPRFTASSPRPLAFVLIFITATVAPKVQEMEEPLISSQAECR